ncbi:hypothetical protein BgAZ_209100 [Babesia gibsoni]|uniref:Uncharacterized protein n=1 Tax=Babesia gibsoni TaxID=33632 RepID=A0AAD8PEW4_BABGI|nr:hypothetical protein BgAZ_209100 [Babesia gibsoni]
MRFFGRKSRESQEKKEVEEPKVEVKEEETIAEKQSIVEPLLPDNDPCTDVESDCPAEDIFAEPKDDAYVAMDYADSSDEANDLYDAIHGIYSIGVEASQDKAALYGRMMHYYAEKAGSIPHPPRRRAKSVMWYMLAVLISNPFIGLYTMFHFSDWDTWVIRDAVVYEKHSGGLLPVPRPDGVDRSNGGLTVGKPQDDDEGREPLIMTVDEHDVISAVATRFSRSVRGYAYYEIFGELIFALFSLALLCTSNMCCTNGRHRTQSMVPIIGLLYTVIYKILAMYILIVSFKILMFYVIASWPNQMAYLPGFLLRLMSLKGINASEGAQRAAMSQLFVLDPDAHRWVIIYCLENVYITISDSIETVHALSKISSRAVRKVIKKIRRQQELVYFTMGNTADASQQNEGSERTSCSYMLLDSLLNKMSGPQEMYIHDMYNKGVPEVGTYLDSIDADQYKDSIARMGQKIMNQIRSKDYQPPQNEV